MSSILLIEWHKHRIDQVIRDTLVPSGNSIFTVFKSDTLWQLNIAMEHDPFVDDLDMNHCIFSMAVAVRLPTSTLTVQSKCC